MSTTFDQSRVDELEKVSEAIEGLSNAPDLDALWDQQRAIRDRLLNAWPELIGDDEHSDWLDKLNVATRSREHQL